jgi:hypothetical protein
MEEARLARRSGRGIRRLITLCGTITQLVAEYDRRLLEPDGDDDDNDDGDGDGNGDGDGGDNNLPPETKEEIDRYVL